MTASEELFERASRVIPGGVDSPVRAFGGVGGTPVFIERGEGANLIDVDGNRYVDLVQSWGALLFGHARREIVEAATAAAAKGTSFGAPTEAEVELASRIVEAVPSVDQVRLVNSGTEAAMSAIRLARGATGRDLVVKFAGCYHGHSDSLLAKGAGSGLATLGIPSSPGVTEGSARDTLTVAFNDLEAVRALVAERGDEIAVIAVEPVAANMGVVPPEPGFLEGLRELCDASGALLFFDEVITGFRVAYGGAQTFYGVTPDLSAFGKVMGGGFPCAAFGGRADLMRTARAHRPRLPGGHPQREPGRRRSGHRGARPREDDGPLSSARSHGRCAHRRAHDGVRRRRDRDDDQPGGLVVQRVLRARPGPRLRRRGGSRPRAVRAVLPPHAGCRRVPAPLGLRAVDAQRRARSD